MLLLLLRGVSSRATWDCCISMSDAEGAGAGSMNSPIISLESVQFLPRSGCASFVFVGKTRFDLDVGGPRLSSRDARLEPEAGLGDGGVEMRAYISESLTAGICLYSGIAPRC